ncbi:MAG: cation diffusion facilitator family transporter [Clostridiales bacterium]|nr:cation diffusion facilitator family transporter [Clostridiales bacterium]
MMQNLAMKLLRKGESPTDQPVRKRLGTLGSAVGVGVNALLSLGKLLIGSLTGSVAVTADAINNLSDAAGSVVSLVSMRLAQKPVDQEHPFGHGRLEYLGALAVGVMILFMGVETFANGVRSILSPKEIAFGWVPLGLMILSILIKGGLFVFYRAVGRLIDFPSLIAAAKDSLSDMLATSAVVVSMLVGYAFGLPIDGYMGVAVSLLVLKAGLDVVRDTVDSLMGGRKNPELGREIISRLLKYEHILGAHDLLIHDYGPGRCIASVHAEVPADGDILVLHDIIDQAEHEIGEELNIPLCIHMDPIVTGDAKTDEAHARLSEFLKGLDGGFMLHDLRMVPGETHTNLIFDVVIPAGYKDTKTLTEKITRAAKEINPRYECVIHYDIDYYH